MKFLNLRIAFLFLAAVSCTARPEDGEHTLHLFTTNDVHGCYFDSLYVGDDTRPSLLAVSRLVSDARGTFGPDKVMLVDAGDCLQGDNAAYYFNYVRTDRKHLYARMAEYMGYDAVVVGNHDMETGHAVYDRLRRTMRVPFLAANAVSTDNGKAWFDEYVLLRRDGFRILVLGCTNANIKAWLAPELWDGLDFKSLLPFVQTRLDEVLQRTSPDVVVVAVHSGTGEGDGSALESQGLDLLDSLRGVDFLVCAHDHRPFIEERDSCVLVNSGSHCRNVGHAVITLDVRDGKVVSRRRSAELLPVDKARVDTVMAGLFRKDYEEVRDFTTRKVGQLVMPLRTRDAYSGMSDYLNLLHTVALRRDSVRISIAAPLSFDGNVDAGELIYNDLFTIYPYENYFYVVRMTGGEIRRFLEYSYDGWIRSPGTDGHVLRIRRGADPRYGSEGWSFIGRPYNFDSAAGLVYTVDVTEAFGSRVSISSLADGSPFREDAFYNVAMNSYRVFGGGRHMPEGAGIGPEVIEDRIVERGPEVRELIYDLLKSCPVITPELVGDPSLIGGWSFVPEDVAAPAIGNDLKLLFPNEI